MKVVSRCMSPAMFQRHRNSFGYCGHCSRVVSMYVLTAVLHRSLKFFRVYQTQFECRFNVHSDGNVSMLTEVFGYCGHCSRVVSMYVLTAVLHRSLKFFRVYRARFDVTRKTPPFVKKGKKNKSVAHATLFQLICPPSSAGNSWLLIFASARHSGLKQAQKIARLDTMCTA